MIINHSFFSFKNTLEQFDFYEPQNDLQGWLDRAVLAHSYQRGLIPKEEKDFAKKTIDLFRKPMQFSSAQCIQESPETTLRGKIHKLSNCLIHLRDRKISDEILRAQLSDLQEERLSIAVDLSPRGLLKMIHSLESLIQDFYLDFISYKTQNSFSFITSALEHDVIRQTNQLRELRRKKESGDINDVYLELSKTLNDLSQEEKWKFPEEKFRIAFAKLAAQQSGWNLSEYIENYGIQDEAARIEIAKLAAQQDGSNVSTYIENYGIKEEAARIEIAKLAAQQSGWGTSAYIENYGIEEEAARVEIAKLAAQENGSGTSMFIKNYGIEGEAARIEIAKLVAQQNGWSLSEYIESYGIEDEAARIEIAKLAAQENGSGTSEHIENYGIQDEAARIEIAKLAQQNGSDMSKYIKNYGIKEEAVRIEIAKLAAQQNGWDISQYIRNYGIEDEGVLIEIAKLAAQQDGSGTSEHIKNYGIEEEVVHIEIAKLAAQQNGLGTSMFIKNYGIKEEAARIEIAKLAAQQTGEGTSKYIKNYGIKDQVALEEIATLAFKNTFAAGEFLRNYQCKEEVIDKLRLFYFIQCICSHKPFPKETEECLERMEKKHPLHAQWMEEMFNDLHKKMEKAKEENNAQGTATLMHRKQCLQLFPLFLLEEHFQLSEKTQGYLREILKHHNIYTAFFFAATFMENLRQKEYLESYIQFIGNNKKTVHHLIIPMVLLSQWFLAASSKPSTEIQVIKDSLLHFRKELRDAKGPMENLLQAMRAFEENPTLTSDKKIEVLRRIFDASKQREKETQDLIHLKFLLSVIPLALERPQWKILEEENWSIDSLMEKILGESLEIDKEQLAAVLTPRGELAAFISYIARLQTVSDPLVEKESKRFIQAVFTGTVAKTRYETENNPHLQEIAEKDPELFQKWQENREEIASSAVSFARENDIRIDFLGFLQQTIITDGHFKEAPQELLDFLQQPEKSKKFPQRNEKGEILSVCQRLCSSSSKETQVKHLKELQKKLSHIPQCEFHNDIAALLKNLHKKQQITVGKDTDNWRDLLLCGTEVLGSCQRIDGDPSLNKCLLAYVLDGKNRLLALKDPHSGKILARAILRLLWDPQKQRPALFQERYYPSPCLKEYQNRLDGLAGERARFLGIDWFKGVGGSTKLVSKESCSPYEYSDAGGGVTNGTFTINAYRMDS